MVEVHIIIGPTRSTLDHREASSIKILGVFKFSQPTTLISDFTNSLLSNLTRVRLLWSFSSD